VWKVPLLRVSDITQQLYVRHSYGNIMVYIAGASSTALVALLSVASQMGTRLPDTLVIIGVFADRSIDQPRGQSF
jgi:hypothetical protein